MANEKISVELDLQQIENIVLGLENRRQYLCEEIRELERSDWLISIEALKRDLLAVRQALAILEPLCTDAAKPPQARE